LKRGGIIKTDEKIKAVEEDDNVIIQLATAASACVPRYEPRMVARPELSHVFEPKPRLTRSVDPGQSLVPAWSWIRGYRSGSRSGGEVHI
jgi:hypothetical protein